MVYAEPRISINKLGEYLTTSKAARRERILRDAKYPPTYQVIRYDPTAELIQRYLSGKVGSLKALMSAIAEYASSPVEGDFETRKRKSNLEAMGMFADMAPSLGFSDSDVTMAPHAPKRRDIAGVAVSVRPELHLKSNGGPNAPVRRGGIKLNISKGAVHGKESAEYVGALLQAYIDEQNFPGECDHERCFTLDVFGQKFVPSPKAVVNRMKDIEAACGEITRQWPSITPS